MIDEIRKKTKTKCCSEHTEDYYLLQEVASKLNEVIKVLNEQNINKLSEEGEK